MNTQSHHAVLPDTLSGQPWLVWGGVVVVQLMFALAGLVYGWPIAFVPLAILVVVSAFVWPRASLYVLATLTFFRYSLPGTRGIYPAALGPTNGWH